MLYINLYHTFFAKSLNGYILLITFLILAILSFGLPKIVFAKESSFPEQVAALQNKKVSSGLLGHFKKGNLDHQNEGDHDREQK